MSKEYLIKHLVEKIPLCTKCYKPDIYGKFVDFIQGNYILKEAHESELKKSKFDIATELQACIDSIRGVTREHYLVQVESVISEKLKEIISANTKGS